MNERELGYLIVTDYIKADSGKDVSDELQKLILDNPNRTLYFPDGVYLISEPICTPANPIHSVSLVLSCYATNERTCKIKSLINTNSYPSSLRHLRILGRASGVWSASLWNSTILPFLTLLVTR